MKWPRFILPVFVVPALLASTFLLLEITVPAGARGQPPLVGRWDRLNPDQSNPTPEHEVLRCGGNISWNCTYDKHPEPRLGFENPPDSTSGRFRGEDVTSQWECPDWFPEDVCGDTTFVVRGVMNYELAEGGSLVVDQELVVTEYDGQEVLYAHWIGQFVCPWYRSFAEALAANPFPTPFDGEHWPAMDCAIAP